MIRERHPKDTPAPTDGADLLHRLYGGALFVFGATAGSKALVDLTRRAVEAALGDAPPPGGTLPALSFEQIQAIREDLYARPELLELAARTVEDIGLPDDVRVDQPRLRAVVHGAEATPQAAPVYVAHRDTWYACPQTQINWWLPIFDCPKAQSFVFYPEDFERPVDNASGRFDYQRWTDEVGWHGEAPLDDYPAPAAELAPRPEVRFDARAGELLLFSAAHLHQTRANPVPGTTRLSLDFRTVSDACGPGAPNVDNASVGAERRVARELTPVRAILGA